MKHEAQSALGLGEAPQETRLEGGRVRLWPAFFPADDADRFLRALWSNVSWAQHHVRIAGRRIPSPRLSAWYGDPGARYAYSGESYDPLPWEPELRAIRDRVSSALGVDFNSVLLNAYRDGEDSMGLHADDEPELGRKPVIASVSLGAVRRFRLRSRNSGVEPVAFDLPHGSLLVMDGETQSNWRHGVPKTRRSVGLRLNLTLRRIRTSPSA